MSGFNLLKDKIRFQYLPINQVEHNLRKGCLEAVSQAQRPWASVSHTRHQRHCCHPVIPQLFYFTACKAWRLKCFRLTWGFPLELTCLPSVMTKQNSVDWARSLLSDYLCNQLLVPIFSFFFFFHLVRQSCKLTYV